MYLEQGLLQHVQANDSLRVAGNRTKIYKALRNHRHTVSDPGFDKISIGQCALPHSFGVLGQPPKAQPTDGKSTPNRVSSAVEMSATSQQEVSCYRETVKHPAERIDCACQTPDGDWAPRKGAPVASQCDHTNLTAREPNAGHNMQCGSGRSCTGRNSMIETEPSEGYHSQQSSGSPTPNTEKSTVYFPTPGDCTGSPSSTTLREASGVAMRRNRSADVLPSLNV